MTPSLTRLLDLPASYQVLAVAANRQQVAITLASMASSAPCPLCGTRSSRLHSNYQRTVADLPCAGRQILFHLHTHKWRCLNPACARQVFAERLDPFIRVFARMTTRLSQALERIGLVTNAEGGTSLAKHLGMTASPTTLLRRIMAISEPASPPPKKIGRDEWAYRRGRRYGTIIVDLERHQVVDLLADREVNTVVAWLEQHPTIELVSRDRSREFARAIAQGAPQAIQVLDRWQRLEESDGDPTAHPGPLLYRTASVTPARARNTTRRARQGQPLPAALHLESCAIPTSRRASARAPGGAQRPLRPGARLTGTGLDLGGNR